MGKWSLPPPAPGWLFRFDHPSDCRPSAATAHWNHCQPTETAPSPLQVATLEQPALPRRAGERAQAPGRAPQRLE
ncbi:hypothetical protein SCAR479_07924 [Seiridium cardinale]|uniref:Uncharacterized protein n=1 Tax=Seiridium cardinale TaxID=138064 RepID=A0ABR2XPC5_9PEZI